MMSETTACSCRWLHTIVVYDPQCPLHQRPTTATSDADCAHVWDRVLTQEGTPTERQCQRCGIIQSGSATEDAVVLEGIEAFVLMVQVIADQTVTRSFEQIAEDELVKLRKRVARSAQT
jgi:hypothetical protein